MGVDGQVIFPAKSDMRPHTEGSTIIEAALVVMLLCLVLFGGVQISRLYASKEILDYAAMAGARAKAVGLNDFMVYKVVKVASIPNAGKLKNPDVNGQPGGGYDWANTRPGYLWDRAVAANPTRSRQYNAENSRIPFYLGAEHYGRLPAILDYSDWDTIIPGQDYALDDEQVWVRAQQDVPVLFPFHRAFMDDDEVSLQAGEQLNRGARMANQAKLYLESFNE